MHTACQTGGNLGQAVLGISGRKVRAIKRKARGGGTSLYVVKNVASKDLSLRRATNEVAGTRRLVDLN